MRKLFTILFLVLGQCFSFAQSPVGESGKQLNVGMGFTGRGIPVFVGLDFGIHPDITVGGELSYRSYTENYHWNSDFGGGVWKYDHSIIGIVARGDYHFNTLFSIPKQWDVYAGASLGYYIWNTSTDDGDEFYYDGQGDSGLGFGLQIGGRYYFSDKLGVNVEFNGNNVISTGKVGVSYLF